MSRCEDCAFSKNCKYHGSSQLYRKDDSTPVIALLGQPNSGKSTIFNMMTGSHQHVGNWPGKTVDQKEGECKWNGQRMILADLPGSYSLSAGSDEEVITRDYIATGNADLVLVMADASQLKRSLYMLADFVLGITLGFNLMEETGYLARISFLFDHTMSKVGLQGKTIMPFFMGLGCTIAGTTGTRVVDNWGQRVLAIAMSWAVPCAATLSVVPTIAIALFGSTGGFLVMVAIFLFMFLMMWVVYKVFGNSLAPKEERVGLIMELPPYHKPAIKNTLYVTFQRTLDIFLRALRVISLVSIVFFVLTYSSGSSAENSILYKLGVLIEPVTKFFGMKWQAFLAFCASAISKESLLGVLNTLYGTGGSLVSSTFSAKVSGTATAGISEILSANFTKAEGLAFIFAISFNMPCVSALAATARETHSVKWTAKIGVFYTLAALLIACIVYHVGLLIF